MDATTEQARPPIHVVPVLASLVLALVPVQLDALVTAPAIPNIVGSLGGFDQIAWIVTAYLLTMAVGMVLSGRMGDLFGRRAVLIAALLAFLAGTLTCALAGTMSELIVGRAVQGLGAGMTITSLLAAVADIAPPGKRAQYQAVFGAVAPFSMILGPWVGGLVTDHLGWRWIFWLNTPLVILSLVGVVAVLRLPRNAGGGRIDLPGMVALSVASAGVTLAATWGGQYGWASGHVLAAAVVGAVGVAGIWLTERRAAQPVLPLQLFTDRSVLSSLAVMFLATGAIMSTAIAYLPVFLQLVQGRSASSSGLLLLPMLVPAIALALGVGRWTTREDRFRAVLMVGSSLVAVGCAGLALLGTSTSVWAGVAAMMVLGAGLGLLLQTPLVLVQNRVPQHEVGAATGTAQYLRKIGGAIGVGALGSVFVNRFATDVAASGVPGTAGLDIAHVGPHQLDALSPAAHAAVLNAAASANSQLFWIGVGLALLAVAAAVLAPRLRPSEAPDDAALAQPDDAPSVPSPH